MVTKEVLAPASDLARKNGVRFPNESDEYRRARDALLAEEIELRRHIERVAEQRRALPPGGEVTKDYRFDGEDGPIRFADLFGDKQTLAVYSYMFGPQRERPCPMCTSLLSAWDGEAPDVEQRIAFAVVARSPIERLVAFKKERGWRNLKLYSDMSGEYSRDYYALSKKGDDDAAFNVFTRRDGAIRHFWSGEDGLRNRRSRSGPARRTRPHADMDDLRFDAGGPSCRLVSEARIREPKMRQSGQMGSE